MGKVELNKKQKKESLYSTAFELFTTKGLSKTTISDIVNNAGVAKGTFYLYFKDKYDIRNKLVTHKASELLINAHIALSTTDIDSFEDQIIFIIDHVVNELKNNTSLLQFIAKNLSWGVFKKALLKSPDDSEDDFFKLFLEIIPKEQLDEKKAELLLFQIIEYVGATAHSTILYEEPVGIDEFMPHMHTTVRLLINSYLN